MLKAEVTEAPITINRLPYELIRRIIECLDLKSLLSLQLTSKFFLLLTDCTLIRNPLAEDDQSRGYFYRSLIVEPASLPPDSERSWVTFQINDYHKLYFSLSALFADRNNIDAKCCYKVKASFDEIAKNRNLINVNWRTKSYFLKTAFKPSRIKSLVTKEKKEILNPFSPENHLPKEITKEDRSSIKINGQKRPPLKKAFEFLGINGLVAKHESTFNLVSDGNLITLVKM
jgi:hypothetical protein